MASHKLGFDKWCKQEFGWSNQHVHRILDSWEIVKLTSPMGEVVAMPTNERQCRELSSVPKDKVAEVWTEAGRALLAAMQSTAKVGKPANDISASAEIKTVAQAAKAMAQMSH